MMTKLCPYNCKGTTMTVYFNNAEWPPHHLVNKESKTHRIKPILPSKTAWDFSRKEKCDFIVRKWQMYFQTSDYKGRNFLELNDNDGVEL